AYGVNGIRESGFSNEVSVEIPRRFTFKASSFGTGPILAGGVEAGGLARGPAFELFDLTGALLLARFALNPRFVSEVQFDLGNLDADPLEEVLVGGREIGGPARGPALQIFEPDGTLKATTFAFNADFSEAAFSVADLGSPGILVCGTETGGLARGPAFQLFDGEGALLRTRFVLNADFRESACLGADLDGLAGDEIVFIGRESGGLGRGPAVQVFGADGTLWLTHFVLNRDFSELQVSVADAGGRTIVVAGRETGGLARGPAFQTFDSTGALLQTHFALNPDFSEVGMVAANIDGVGNDEIVIGGRESRGLARGPAFQVFAADGTLRHTRFTLNAHTVDASFAALDVDDDGAKEILVLGRETGGLARGPLFQLFDGDGTLLLTRFVLNPDFTDLAFFRLPQPDGTTAIGIGGVERQGLARGAAIQIWDSTGNLLVSGFVLNPDF
ncbi:MAG: hypothetical protein GWN53_02635, partial [Gammaproteobacteria bacterium]|nr:hypothetical protein [Gammaproteobacteria bacterium]NIV75364.1 hypothetical protein [Gammaproteobacteria bacterium]NIW85046.1 hypothetical protein [Gammaproteobacteria bacterium]